MPFLLAEILNFQGSTHRIGVGSLVIYKLLSYPKKTFSRAQLMDEFWGVDSDTSLRAVDVYVTKLRDNLSACDGFKIVTVRGLGYKAVLQ